MILKRSPGMRIVDLKTNGNAGVFDINGRVQLKQEYIKMRLSASRKNRK